MQEGEKKKVGLLTLFLLMAKLGLVAFGGGWGVISMIEQEFCDKRGWLSQEELLDYVALGRSFPGIMIMNISSILGYRLAGIPGSFVATAGLAVPSITVIALVTVFYDYIRSNTLVDRALVGVRAAVVPVVISALLKLKSTAITGPWTVAVALAGAVLCYGTDLNSALIVLGGVALGVLSGIILKGRDRHAAGH